MNFKRYDAKTIAIKSEVIGSQDQCYHQDIFINVRQNGMVDIDGDCSCPVRLNCKHMVAALLAHIEKEKNRYTPSQVRGVQWLEDFSKLSSTEVQEEHPEFLLYRLFEEGTYKVEALSFYKSKVLKKGGISKGIRLANLLHESYKHEYLNSDDHSILPLLKALIPSQWSENVTFEGEIGAMVLKQMVATGRCYYRDAVRPLTFSKEIIEVEFFWKSIDDNKRKIESNLPLGGTFISSQPPLYIDPVQNSIQVLSSTYDTTSVDLLLQAPEVEVEDINLFMNKAFDLIPDIEIPMPKEFDYEEREVTPVPYLELLSDNDENGRTVHFMRLFFRYETHQLTPFPQKGFLRFLEQERTVRIVRDREKETSAIDTLQSYGFELNTHHNETRFFSFAVPDMQTAIERWRLFLEEGREELEKSGWIIEVDERFDFQFEYSQNFVIHSQESETHGWFDLSYEVDIAGVKVSLLPLITNLLRDFDSVQSLPQKLNLQLEDKRFLHVDAEDIKPILRTIFELYNHIDEDRIKLEAYDAHLVSGFEDNHIQWKGSLELAELSTKLQSFEGIKEVVPSQNLTATLREYQQFGVNWINFLHQFRFAGILADDMGLGKTLQTLAFLQKLKEMGQLSKPTLIIMPTSLIGNWKNEVQKFTNTLSVLSLYGSDRAELFPKIKEYDLILSTYQLALRDKEKFDKEHFEYIILDEAQKIKNPKAKMTLAIKSFSASHRLALTGTPMENHLGELWSIFDFLMPGFLGTLSFFKKEYQTPIEKNNDIRTQERLKRKIAPFMLRRTKDEVLEELPEKIEIIQKVTLGTKQALLYENVRLTMEQKVRDVVVDKGLSRSHITILDALLKLRQICCDPSLLSLSEASKVKESAKLETFFELIEELLAEGRKILVFSQFTSMLKVIQEALEKKSIDYALLTGQTKKREEVIEKFKQSDCNIFLISLKAGGVGLNLVEADTVIHYDPWWNPAVENQATDRAHRIGQSKTVFVYKLVVANSIEEKILKLQEKKKSLQEGVYDTTKDEKQLFDAQELIDLLRT